MKFWKFWGFAMTALGVAMAMGWVNPHNENHEAHLIMLGGMTTFLVCDAVAEIRKAIASQ